MIDSSLLSLVLVHVLVSLCACHVKELYFFLFFLLAALQGSHEAANPSRVYYADVDKLGRVYCPDPIANHVTVYWPDGKVCLYIAFKSIQTHPLAHTIAYHVTVYWLDGNVFIYNLSCVNVISFGRPVRKTTEV